MDYLILKVCSLNLVTIDQSDGSYPCCRKTLRQRFDLIGSSIRRQILDENIKMLKSNGGVPSKLPCGYVPVDMDVSPFDNSKTCKEGVSRTYKGCDSYAPMFAYIGSEGYLANLELREGKQHCQKGTPQFLEETIGLCRQLTDAPCSSGLIPPRTSASSWRVDAISSFSATSVRKAKRTGSGWQKTIPLTSPPPRDSKDVYIGSDWKEITYQAQDGTTKHATIRMGYEIIRRTVDKKGQFLLIPDIEANVWWINTDLPDREVIRHYHAHGESEQFPKPTALACELKTDMDLERLPSSKFETNELVLELAILSYNILRMIGQEALGKRNPHLKRAVKRRRHRTVINNLINMACHVTKHARKLIIGLGKSNVWRDVFRHVYYAFEYFAP